MKRHYFLADLRRLWKGYEVYAAILGVAATLFFSMESRELKNGNVMFSYFYATEMSGFMIAYVFCAFPYAASLCEDLEHKYVRYQTVRGSLKRYVASKVGVVYLSSVLAMVLGSMLFVAYCRTQGPWVNEEDIGPYVNGVYESLVESGHYGWYCAFYALQLGFLAAILSVLSAFFSLYITNKVTVFILPVVIYKVVLDKTGSGMYTVLVFRAYNKPFEEEWQCLLFVFAVSAVLVAALAWGIFRKLKARM